jgi:hypothetical protein
MMSPKSFKTGLLLLSQLHLARGAMLAPRQQVTCNFATAASAGDTCQSFSAEWGLTEQTFESLNPGISCPDLVAGQNYCVVGSVASGGGSSTFITTTKPSTSSQIPTSSSSAPDQPQQTGTVTNCNKFYLVQSGDTCPAIEAQFGISMSQFIAWNPSVNTGMPFAFHQEYSYSRR